MRVSGDDDKTVNECGGRERQCGEQGLADGEAPATDEVAGQEREDHETQVPREPSQVTAREARGDASEVDGDGRTDCEGNCDGPPAVRLDHTLPIRQHELTPQPSAVFLGELPGKVVDRADSLDRDQERFFVGEPGPDEIIDLIAQVRLEFLQVAPFELARDERSPLGELVLELFHVQEAPKAKDSMRSPPQMSPRARVTVIH